MPDKKSFETRAVHPGAEVNNSHAVSKPI
jgi:hypothetical protein